MKSLIFLLAGVFYCLLIPSAAHCEKRLPVMEKTAPILPDPEFRTGGGDSGRISFFIRKPENKVLHGYKQALTRKGWQVLMHHNRDKSGGHGELQLVRGEHAMDIRTEEMPNGSTGVTIRLRSWNPATCLLFFVNCHT